MPNPYVMLGLALVLIASHFGAYRHGVKVQKGEVAVETVTAFQTLIDNHNKLVKEDTDAAVKAEAERQAYKRQALERKNRVLQDALAKARPVCDRDAESFGLLLDSIRAANRPATPAPSPVPAPVR